MIFWTALEDGEGAIDVRKSFVPSPLLPIYVVGAFVFWYKKGFDPAALILIAAPFLIIGGMTLGDYINFCKKRGENKIHSLALRNLVASLAERTVEDFRLVAMFNGDTQSANPSGNISFSNRFANWKVWYSESSNKAIIVGSPPAERPRSEGVIWEVPLHESPSDLKIVHGPETRNGNVPFRLHIGQDVLCCIASVSSINALKSALSKPWVIDLRSNDISIRAKALDAINNLSNEAIINKLIDSLRDSDTSSIAGPWLKELRSNDISVRTAAQVALAKIGYKKI